MKGLASLLLLTLFACILSSGCKDNNPTKGGGPKPSDPKWSGSGTSNSVIRDGVNYPLVSQDLMYDGRVYFVMRCTAGQGEGSSAKYDSSNGNATGTFTIHPDGRPIAWSCKTPDGTSGAVVIDGQNFDLAKGAIFLVTLKDKKTNVDQVAVDMAKLQGGPLDQKLQAVAETEPRIATFLKASRGEK